MANAKRAAKNIIKLKNEKRLHLSLDFNASNMLNKLTIEIQFNLKPYFRRIHIDKVHYK